MSLLLINVWNFAGPCWIVNILHNFIVPLDNKYAWVRTYNKPLDGGIFFFGNRLLGDSITSFGLIISLLAPFFLQFFFKQHLDLLLLKSLCTFAGGTLGSFIKRRYGYSRGAFVPIIDHGDYILFTGSLLLIIHQVVFLTVIITLVITYLIHPLACIVGYKLKIKSEPY